MIKSVGQRYQHPYLFRLPTRAKLALVHFFNPPQDACEWRCDIHPRASRDGKLAGIASPHHRGGRQMCLVDISKLL